VGRDASLTGRRELWDTLLPMTVNPLVGAGFESFWLGPRIMLLWEQFAFRPNQAHNGYLEIYLNLGGFGLMLFVMFLISSFKNMRRKLEIAYTRGSHTADEMTLAYLGVAYLIAMLFYNTTEATFKALNYLFIVFLFFAVRYSEQRAPQPAIVSSRQEGPRRRGVGKVVSVAPEPTSNGVSRLNRKWLHGQRAARVARS
jgi:exopolysaccharide production protein ExoQ